MPTFPIAPPTQAPATTLPTPTPALSEVEGAACADGLRFVQDINYRDNTPVGPGQRFVKKWQVENNGTCDWGSHYRLGLSGGLNMGTDGVQALYPARAGTRAELSIPFVAPDVAGTYRSEWRAYSPAGDAFGDTLYVQVVVAP